MAPICKEPVSAGIDQNQRINVILHSVTMFTMFSDASKLPLSESVVVVHRAKVFQTHPSRDFIAPRVHVIKKSTRDNVNRRIKADGLSGPVVGN